MTQYIDKAALVAEIQKLYDKDYHYLPSDIYGYKDEFLAIIDELEVKEINLEKIIEQTYHDRSVTDTSDMDHVSYENIARHFFELGLKAQKE